MCRLLRVVLCSLCVVCYVLISVRKSSLVSGCLVFVDCCLMFVVVWRRLVFGGRS